MPAAEVGPLRVVHDHRRGTCAVEAGGDALGLLEQAGGPVTAQEIARGLYGEQPSRAQVERARRKLEDAAEAGRARRIEGSPGAAIRYLRTLREVTGA